MGAEFISAGQWIEHNRQINLDAGRQAAFALDGADLESFRVQVGLLTEPVSEVREHALFLVDQFEEAHDVAIWTTPDLKWDLWFTGAQSAGDSPGEMYDALTDLSEAPSVLRALGFHDGPVPGTVTVALGVDGTVPVGTVQVDYEEDESEDALAYRQAAVAWNALTRNGTFKVGTRQFTATECAEWWA